MTLEQKQCTKCGQVKPISEFRQDSRYKDGYQGWCRACRTVQARARRGSVQRVQWCHDEAELARLYVSGLSLNDLARRYGIGPSSIRRRLRKIGIERRPFGNVKLTGAQRQAIYLRYGHGEKLADLANEYGVDPSTISRTYWRLRENV
jgi:transposase-like protein